MEEVIDACIEVLKKVSKMQIIGAMLSALIPILIFEALGLPSLFLNSWWFDSIGLKDIVFMVNVKSYFGMFFISIIVSSIVYLINWMVMKHSVKKMLEEQALREAEEKEINTFNFGPIGSIYAFLSVLVIAFFSWKFSQHYFMFLECMHQSSFGVNDPIFGNDIGFYVFTLPVVWKVLNFIFWNSLFLFVVDIVIWIISASEERLENDKSIPLMPRIFGCLMIFYLGLYAYLGKYDVLNLIAESSFLTGAGYNDIQTQPFWSVVFGLLIMLAGILFLVKTKSSGLKIQAAALILVALCVVAAIVVPSALSSWKYSNDVKPNEQIVQEPYIRYSIDFTRAAYDIKTINEINYSNNVILDSSIKKSPSVQYARVFDWRAQEQFLNREQAIQRYYTFNLPDVDRYRINGSEGQVIIAARELNPAQIPQTWENQHLIYTHGHGSVMGSVNQMGADRMPLLYLRDIPSVSTNPEFKVKNEGIWYGENTNNYIFTNTLRAEFDYPTGSRDVYNYYNGTGGIVVGNIFRKAVIAWEMSDIFSIMRSDYITDSSRLHIYRNVSERVKTIAPFLYYDADPYIFNDAGEENLKWILSGVAYAENYPYSQKTTLDGNNNVNYVRDGAKVFIDAMNGTVKFYAVKEDPVMKTYMNIYPGLFESMDKMPISEKEHIKYPEDLFNIQTKKLCTFHMTDPRDYYMKNDQWKLSEEITDSGELKAAIPYNMILENGNGTSYELMRTFNPADPQRTNMVSWFSINQDYPDYGKMLLYKFNTTRTINGPAQIDAFINQDTEFSKMLTLWNQQGSRVIRGNLLVIPVNGGIINIKPIYISSSSKANSMPELATVIVFYENPITKQRILKWGDTLESAMDQIFAGGTVPVSSNAQNQIQQGFTSHSIAAMQIIILDSNGQIKNTISVQSNESFIVNANVTANNSVAAAV